MRTTYTYVKLPVSQGTYDEIAKILREADYGHAFKENGDIDLHGLALAKPAKQATTLLRDMVPKAELRKIEREAWWYRHFAPYRWYINWGWNR